MPRFSQTSRCAICGKEVSQSGPARQWVHENEFYAKADHPADPAGKTYLTAKAASKPAPVKQQAPAEANRDGTKARSVADLRRRLLQGSSEISADDSAARRRRIAAIDTGAQDIGLTEADIAARRLRMMRQAAEDEQRR